MNSINQFVKKKLLNNNSKKHSLGVVDLLVDRILFGFALLSSSFIIVIIIFVTLRGIIPFISDNNGLGRVELLPFITGTIWIKGETFVSTAYGVGFLILNTLYIAFLSLLISFPIGVLTALFIAKIAPKKIAYITRTIIELLAGIPSIVFGLVGAGMLLPLIYNVAELFGKQTLGGNSTLATVIVLAVMSIPTITAISEVSIRSVNPLVEQASLALGATNTQTHYKVTLLSAKSGIFASAILAIGRALGEATAVSLVAGNSRSGPNLGMLDITSTITSTMLQGLKETTGIDYDIRFSLGVVLMVVILVTNIILNIVKSKVGNIHEKS